MNIPSNMRDPGAAANSLSDEDFHAIATLAKNDTGISLSKNKREMIRTRLAPVVRKHGLESFHDYVKLLQSSEAASSVKLEFISRITTNVTSFFRERHHFEFLVKTALPSLLEDAPKKELLVWSAGCSLGHEAYSLAIAIGNLASPNTFRVLATDIDDEILAVASAGRYHEGQLKGLTKTEQERHFTEEKPGVYQVVPSIKETIVFKHLNLIEHWPLSKRYDIVFFRNVAIYFDQELQEKLWLKFSSQIELGGYLFIGHSERISGPALEYFDKVSTTVYKKVA